MKDNDSLEKDFSKIMELAKSFVESAENGDRDAAEECQNEIINLVESIAENAAINIVKPPREDLH